MRVDLHTEQYYKRQEREQWENNFKGTLSGDYYIKRSLYKGSEKREEIKFITKG
jgi:hypothetical protein